MRRFVAPCACVLALITGAWFGQAYTLFTPINPGEVVDTLDQGTTVAAWRYYEAVDILFRTGDDSLLERVISPDFVDHVDLPGALGNRDELLGHLNALRTTYPALTIVPQDLIAKGDRSVARLKIGGGSDGSVSGIPYGGPLPWPEVEVIRIADGQVVERWGGPVGYALATPLFSEILTVPSQGPLPSFLRRVTLAPDSNDAVFRQDGPAIVLVESGALVATTGSRDGSSTPVANQLFAPGDSVAISEKMDLTASNVAGEPAILLVLHFVQKQALPSRQAASPLIALDSRVQMQELAGNAAVASSYPGGTVAAELVRITLAPGMRLSPHPIGGVHIVFVEDGTLSVTANGAAFSAWIQAPNGHSTYAGQHAELAEEYGLSIAGMEEPSNDILVGYRNVTDHSVTFLLVRLSAP